MDHPQLHSSGPRRGKSNEDVTERLDEFKKTFESGAPPYNAAQEELEVFHRATAELKASGIEDGGLKVRTTSGVQRLKSGSGAGFLRSRSARRANGGQLLPRAMVAVLQRGARELSGGYTPRSGHWVQDLSY